MIILINVKDFVKKPKKFYKLRETHVINGSENAEVTKIKEAESSETSAFQPSKTLLKSDLVGYTKEDRKKKEKKFLKDATITKELAKAVATQLDDIDSNVYILLDKKVFNAFADKFIERFAKLLDLDDPEDLFIKYNDYDTACKLYKKYLKKKLDKTDDEYGRISRNGSDSELDKLDDRLDDLEFEYRSPDREEAMKYVLKNAKPSKDVRKKMDKFLRDVKPMLEVNGQMIY